MGVLIPFLAIGKLVKYWVAGRFQAWACPQLSRPPGPLFPFCAPFCHGTRNTLEMDSFGMLFEVLFDFRKFGGWVLFAVLFKVTVRAHFCEIDGRVQGGMQFSRCCFGMLLAVLLEVLVTARALVCSIDGRVLFGALFGRVLLEVLACNHCYLRSMLVCWFPLEQPQSRPITCYVQTTFD